MNNLIRPLAWSSIVLAAFIAVACAYKAPDLPAPLTGSRGTLDFSNYIAVGNSLTAGFSDGALYAEAQSQSYPGIMAQQFALTQTGVVHNIATMPAGNGWGPGPNASLPSIGRLTFNASPCTGFSPTPTGNSSNAFNYPADAFYTSVTPAIRSSLHNYGVPGIKIIEATFAGYGNPANGAGRFNPYFTRIANNVATSSVISDAAARQPTFFSMWLGNNDVLVAAFAGLARDPSTAPPYSTETLPFLTPTAVFQASFEASLDAMLASRANVVGVVANIPSIARLAAFNTIVPFNYILPTGVPAGVGCPAANSQATIDGINAGWATVLGAPLPRLFTVTSGNLLITTGAGVIRQARAGDRLITATASGELGLGRGISPAAGALSNSAVLDEDEITIINARIAAYNTAINTVLAAGVPARSTRVALVDAFTIFRDFGLPATAALNANMSLGFATGGMLSADGVHPTPAGYAVVANYFIRAINAKFGSNIQPADVSRYRRNILP
jgi:hypothetical protein